MCILLYTTFLISHDSNACTNMTVYLNLAQTYKIPLDIFPDFITKAKINNFRFHDLRHTAATRMVEKGIDLVVVKDILGHADINVTMRYAHPVPEMKLKAIKALNDY